MNTPVIAIRPQPALSETLEQAAALDLPVTGIALSKAKPCEWVAPDPADYDAILAGSANAFRHGGKQLDALKSLPVMAVGEQTAQAARDAGFTVSHVGTGGLQGVIDGLDDKLRRLLRISGKDHVALTWPDRLTVDARIAYQMDTLPLSYGNAALLSKGAIVLLFSASSAAHFWLECERMKVSFEHISIAALGPRIAAAAGSGWAAVHTAANPKTAELLALAQQLWQLKPSAPSGGGAADPKKRN